MKNLNGYAMLALGVVLGLAAYGLVEGQPASAQPVPPTAVTAPANRFQVSAYSSPEERGCYVIDTATGALWHVASGVRPAKLADRMP
jgi:hypothetical protein